ncbi:hypothetical protein BDQ17DRAFT_1027363 [Cyathus striatus]|nr:hypothetical protein BDQ17DRAFT_1027363 [Cyathus striatus]
MPSSISHKPPLSTVRLVVSSNGEQYRVVDVTGATSGTWIREHIFSKLSIPEDYYRYYSIYPSEIGSFALGGPLSDKALYTQCRDRGDPSGSLKFFISISPDRPAPQYEPGFAVELASPYLVNRS